MKLIDLTRATPFKCLQIIVNAMKKPNLHAIKTNLGDDHSAFQGNGKAELPNITWLFATKFVG